MTQDEYNAIRARITAPETEREATATAAGAAAGAAAENGGRWWDLASARLDRQGGREADHGDLEAGA